MKQISLFAFSCIVSIGTLLLYNVPFFNYVADNTNETIGGKMFLLASLVVVMLALHFMLASGFFSWGLWLFIAACGAVPALYCLLQPVVFGNAKKLGIYCGSALAIVLFDGLK